MSSGYNITGLTKKPGEAQMLYKKKYELNLEEHQPTKKTAEELKLGKQHQSSDPVFEINAALLQFPIIP